MHTRMKPSRAATLDPGVKRAIRHLAAMPTRRRTVRAPQPTVPLEPLLDRYREAKQRKSGAAK